MFTNEIIKCTNGILINKKDIKFENFSIDSRTIKDGDLFISIRGEKFDGNDFIEESIKKGAIGIIFEGELKKELFEIYKDIVFINVEDSIKALQNMAKYKRSLYNIPVVAITGSVGKTSTKDIVASVMKKKYNVLSTEGNFNNHIGLPLTLLKLKDHDAMCIEMGMNHFGEISLLTDILKPNIAIITNIGTAHIGNLGSRENILKAKMEILEGLDNNGKVIINNDDDLLFKWNENNITYKTITYGIDNYSDYNARDIKLAKDKNYFKIYNTEIEFEVPIPGSHFIYNSLCAISIGQILGISLNDIKDAILNFKLSSKRMEVKNISNNITLLIDCYNANYDSMKGALEVLGKYNTRKIAVLGDMLELGAYSEKLHREVGKEVNKNNIDILITIGENSKYIYDSSNLFNKYMCNNNEEAIKILNDIKRENDIILLKASNGMNFTEIINKLY